MNLEQLISKVRDWDLQSTGDPQAKSEYSFILDQLEYHSRNEWRVYLPAAHPDFSSNYMERLAAWIGNMADEADQKLLLRYALHISFFSHDDFTSLYRSAMDREITRWVAEQVGAKLHKAGGKAFHDLVQYHIHKTTWFCPVTDSMDINEFYKTNHLKGIGHRPAFATMEMLAERTGTPNPGLAKSLIEYMANPSLDPNWRLPSLERLVLLEDIVGSGEQCLQAVRWAVAQLGKPVLFVPLILCPNGVAALQAEVYRSAGALTVRAIIELEREDLLGPERQGRQGWKIAVAMEDLATRCATKVPGDPFGFKTTGCSLATFTNTPDNTLPLVHHKTVSGGWERIFPRVYRD